MNLLTAPTKQRAHSSASLRSDVSHSHETTAARELPRIEEPREVAARDARELSRLFFDRLQELEEGTHEYQYARNTLIEMNLSLVHFAANRFRNRGSGEMEDIIQVGTVGLIKAIDRFDLSRENEFTSFAIPYITGEIKRYFRDCSWAVHVPRRLQELRVDLARAKEQLASRMGREATVKELAEYLQMPEQEVAEGLVAAAGYVAGSLDTPNAETGDAPTAPGQGRALAEVLGDEDPEMALVENFQALAPLLTTLDARERKLLQLRFGQEMTQAEIGSELGISQMHVSRLLARTLTKLRTGLLAE